MKNLERYYEPWNVLDQFQQELLNKMRGVDDRSNVVTSHWSPAVDIKEEDDRYTIYADLPGIAQKDIHITMEGDMLTIKGERYSAGSDSGEQQSAFKRTERTYGTFYRRFSLPDIANAEAIEANSDKGVLIIEIPKQKKAQPRKIAVK